MTAFATIYSALLVLVVQTPSMGRSLQMEEVLMVTHIAPLHGQDSGLRFLVSGINGVLSTAVYLATISDLHVTTSSLFSLGTFKSSRTFVAGTYGLPAYNSTPDPYDGMSRDSYAAGSLYSLPSIIDSITSLGLQEGILYDVLQTTVPSGNAMVNATGFNITCGYVPDAPKLRFSEDDGFWEWDKDSDDLNNIYQIYSTRRIICSNENFSADLGIEPGIISIIPLTKKDPRSSSVNIDGMLQEMRVEGSILLIHS
ncbi:hypothetical protein C8R44DRAFT_737086 [Mycena epipterygia]|nr:hypothetical protein C8R44DRAFT_737086 [Mycena epipterygia]